MRAAAIAVLVLLLAWTALAADAAHDVEVTTLELPFQTRSDKLTPQGEQHLAAFVRTLRGRTLGRIEVVGHSDNVPIAAHNRGQFADNQALSAARARTVAGVLARRLGLQPGAVRARGAGDTQPVASNDTARGRAKNRRVEIRIADGVQAPAAAAPAGMPKDRRIATLNLGFAPRDAMLTPDAEFELGEFVASLGAMKVGRIEVIGNTDNVPIAPQNQTQYTDNQALSAARAKAVGEWLARRLNLLPRQLSTRGAGDTNPIATNGTAAGRERNRRVDIVVHERGALPPPEPPRPRMPWLVAKVQDFFLVYFVVLNLVYILLNLISLRVLRGYMENTSVDRLSHVFSGLEPPMSMVVPAYNEARIIVGSIRSMLQLNYPDYEVIVVNDGSTDATLEVLTKEFDLFAFPETREAAIETAAVRGHYRSRTHPNLRVVDKDNGGRADALNAGLNVAEFPLVCIIDADSILQRDSLYLVLKPFLMDPKVVAAGGTIRVANGCTVRDGFLTDVGLPKNPLALFQVIEYLRAFLFGRVGWNRVNALMIISGAFGVFRREVAIAAGGYNRHTIGEDMEMVMKLHRQMRAQKRDYRISFVPDPVCWTEVPSDLKTLGRQRARWHRGLSESLWWNRKLMSRRGGMPGWVGYPYAVIFEWLAPIIEFSGYVFMFLAWWIGVLALDAFLVFLGVAVGMGVLLSVSALLLEEMSFHVYPKTRHLLILVLAAVLENFGYRQLTVFWRLKGLYEWAFRKKSVWGVMQRSAAWQTSG